MNDVYSSNEWYNPIKKRKVLIVLDDMIADVIISKMLHQIVTQLFIRGYEIKTFWGFNYTVIFLSTKRCGDNIAPTLIMKIPNNQELQ